MLSLFLCVSASGGLQLGGSRYSATTARRSHTWPRMADGCDSYDTNEVVIAARKGKVDLLAELLAADSTAANTAVRCEKIPLMDGATSIIWAARQGRFEVCELLVANSADVNFAAESGWTALYAAALNGHDTIVELLVSNGASIQAAMGLGDERTNLNLQRMLQAADLASATPPALQQQPTKPVAAFPPPAAPPAAAAAAPAPVAATDPTAIITSAASPDDAPADWKTAARAVVAAPTPVEPQSTPIFAPTPAASSSSDGALAGMGELDAMKLRLEWRAPASPEEQAGADRARQTVFKYRHDRIKELEAALAYGQPRAPAAASAPAAAAPAPTAPPPAVPAQWAATSAPVVAAAPNAAPTSQALAIDASLLARIQALEAQVNAMGGGFESGYAKGFAEGFIAGREAK